MNLLASFRAIASVAQKEFLHILRDWRILILIFTLPPAFTLLLGHAFEITATSDAPALLLDADKSEASEQLVDALRAKKTFAWRDWEGPADGPVDLLSAQARAAVIIPPIWGESLKNGDPQPIRLVLEGGQTAFSAYRQALTTLYGEVGLASHFRSCPVQCRDGPSRRYR